MPSKNLSADNEGGRMPPTSLYLIMTWSSIPSKTGAGGGDELLTAVCAGGVLSLFIEVLSIGELAIGDLLVSRSFSSLGLENFFVKAIPLLLW